MAVDRIRGVAYVPLVGEKSIECLSDYSHRAILRQFRKEGTVWVDAGALSLVDYDLAGAVPGNGYIAHLFDKPGGTLLATGTAVQYGNRAISNFSISSGTGVEDELVTISYPDRSDLDAAAVTTVTRTYRLRNAGNLAQLDDVQKGSTGEQTIGNLIRAINGTADFGAPEVYHGTLPCYELHAYRTGAVNPTLQLGARDGGTWGNSVTVTTTVTNGAWTANPMSGGTGNAGLLLAFAGADLPNSLLVSGSVTRHVYVEVFGLKDTNLPIKLWTGPALLHASGSVTPAITP